MTNMKHKIWLEKVSLVSRILHTRVDQESYSREILMEQIDLGLEGITTEVEEICKVTGLPNACSQLVGRKEVEEAMVNHHIIEIREEMETLSKMDDIKKTDTRNMQEYMKQKSLENSRIEFLWETNMLETRYHMKGKY